MVYFKDVSYFLSHVFFMAFIYLFLLHRYPKKKTICICLVSIILMSLLDYIKLNMFPDSKLCYLLVDAVQIFLAQFTGIFISQKRNSKVFFIGLSASNYVIVGSITGAILYIYTDNICLALIGNLLMHVIVLFVLYNKIGEAFHKFYASDFGKSWWSLCLVPMFFFSSFSCLAFFPYTLYEHPENILVSISLMITMLVSYVAVMRYLVSETKQMEEYWKNVMFESYIKGLEGQNYLVEQSEKNLRILRHDMRHYAIMIDSLLDQGEYNEIRNVVKHINQVVEENKVHRYCENLILNTILLKIAGQARTLQIDLQLDVWIPKQIPVNEYEFAMVLANLLDNAISCVRGLEQGKKAVKAKIHCTAERLLIDMENECEEKIDFDPVTGLPKSRRGGNHGLGMQSVLAFSDKLGGNIDCYCENNRFRIILFANF